MTDSGYLDGDDNELIKALCYILNYLLIYRENILHTCFHQYEEKKTVYAFMLAIFSLTFHHMNTYVLNKSEIHISNFLLYFACITFLLG